MNSKGATHAAPLEPRPAPAGWNDAALLRALAEGKAQDALAEIVARHGRLVYSICLRILRDHHHAEDAAQAALLVLCRKAPNLSPQTFLPVWLARSARLAALTLRRQMTIQRRHEEEAGMMRTASASTFPPACSAIEPDLDEALEGLPRVPRDAVVLRHLKGMSENETAVALGCPIGTVSARIARGL
jgi:RNA polymerase sigma-70 factor (ECF subfamily)